MQLWQIPLPILRLILALSALVCGLLFVVALMTGVGNNSSQLLSALIMVFPVVTMAQWVRSRERTLVDAPDTAEASAYATYAVIYLGGLPDYPVGRSEKINLLVATDGFHLQATEASEHWFEGLYIRYEDIIDVRIVNRQVGTVEAVLAGLGAHLLTQSNNIHIEYRADNEHVLVLRLEMLTGFTVMGQATVCREFEDLLRTAGLRQMFRPVASTTADQDPSKRIMLLAELHSAGAISDAEFSAKKAEILMHL